MFRLSAAVATFFVLACAAHGFFPFHHGKKKAGDAAAPKELRVLVENALREKEAGRLDRAVRILAEADSKFPGRAVVLAHLGDCHSRLGVLQLAVDEFRKALAAAPGYCLLHTLLGNALVQLGMVAEGSAEYETQIRCDPRAADEDYYNLGVLLLKARRKGEAEDAFRKCLTVSSYFPDAHYQIGLCRLNSGDYAPAAAAFDRYLELEPAGRFSAQARQMMKSARKLAGLPASDNPAVTPADWMEVVGASLRDMVVPSLDDPRVDLIRRVTESVRVVREEVGMTGDALSEYVFGRCQAVVIFPGMLRAAFMVGFRRGGGILLRRLPNGGWSNPVFVSMNGLDYGLQIGGQLLDLFLVASDKRTVDILLRNRLLVGEDVSVMVGTAGKYVEIGTDIRFKARLMAYSKGKGAYLGFSLKGCRMRVDSAANRLYYQDFYNRGMVVSDHQILFDDLLPQPPEVRPLARWLGTDFDAPDGTPVDDGTTGTPGLQKPKIQAPKIQLPK